MYVAGGCLRSLITSIKEYKDIDIFMINWDEIDTLFNALKEEGITPYPVENYGDEDTPSLGMVYTFFIYGIECQVVYKEFDEPGDKLQCILDDFDFDVCRIGVTLPLCENHILAIGRNYSSLVKILSQKTPRSTLWRVERYQEYGYTFIEKEVAELREIVQNLDEKEKELDGKESVPF